MGRPKATHNTSPQRSWVITFWLQTDKLPELLLDDDGRPYDFQLSDHGREAVRYLIWQHELCPDVQIPLHALPYIVLRTLAGARPRFRDWSSDQTVDNGARCTSSCKQVNSRFLSCRPSGNTSKPTSSSTSHNAEVHASRLLIAIRVCAFARTPPGTDFVAYARDPAATVLWSLSLVNGGLYGTP